MKTISFHQKPPQDESKHLTVLDPADRGALAGTRRLECSEVLWDRGSTKFNPSFRWVLDPSRYVLVLGDPDSGHWTYEVDLERCPTKADAFDRVLHVSCKLWASARVMCGLVQALYSVLRLRERGPRKERGTIDVKARVREYIDDMATEEGQETHERAEPQA